MMFKVGDTVERIENSGVIGLVGKSKKYTIKALDGGFLYFNEIIGGFYPYRFKLVEKEEKPKFEVGKEYSTDVITATCIFTGKDIVVLQDQSEKEYVTYNGSLTWKPVKAKGTVWLNIYKNKSASGNQCHSTHLSKQKADNEAAYGPHQRGYRIACIEVPWEEGMGLTNKDKENEI